MIGVTWIPMEVALPLVSGSDVECCFPDSIYLCMYIYLFVCLSIYLSTYGVTVCNPYVYCNFWSWIEFAYRIHNTLFLRSGNRRRQPAPAPATGAGNKPAPATGHSVPEQRTGNRQQGRGKCQLALSNRTRLRSSDHTFGLSCDRKSKRICTIKTQQRNRKDINRYPKKDR